MSCARVLIVQYDAVRIGLKDTRRKGLTISINKIEYNG